MKKLLLVLAIVLCMLMTAALAESAADPSPVGVWADEARTELYEFKDDGTLLLCRPATGRLYPYSWILDVDFIDYGKGFMIYDAGEDTLMGLMNNKLYTRLTDEEYAALIAEVAAATRLDAVLEDFIGSWEYAGLYDKLSDVTYSASEYWFDIHFTITDTTFSLPDGLYDQAGVGAQPTELPCEMIGNTLCIGDEYSYWTARISPDGVLLFNLDSSFPHKCTIYLTKVQEK